MTVSWTNERGLLVQNLMRATGQTLPSPEEFERMKDDLDFKEKEKQNSENTVSGLSEGRCLFDFEWLVCSRTTFSWLGWFGYCGGNYGDDEDLMRMVVVMTMVQTENRKLHENLKNLEDLEVKMKQELDLLKEKRNTMTTEVQVFSDLDKLKADMEVKRNVRRIVHHAITMQCFIMTI